MPRVQRPASEGGAFGSLGRRLENQERASTKPGRSKIEEWASWNWDTPTVPSSYAAVSTWPVRVGGQVVAVHCSAGTAGSTSTTFKVRVNGTQVGSTLTFPASTTNTTLYLGNVRVAPGTVMVVELTAVGTGLLGFTVNVVMKG